MRSFNEILQNPDDDADRALIQAVTWLSVSPGFTDKTKEEIFDYLVETYKAQAPERPLAANDM